MMLYIGRMFEYINSLDSVVFVLTIQTQSTGLNYTIGVLYNDSSFFALITCLCAQCTIHITWVCI